MTNNIKKIFKTAKSVLFADPKLLYEEERHLLNQPFYFAGESGKAVLLIHGWTSTPYEVRRLGEYLHEAGFTVSAPMLRGHGTVPKDLENIRWAEWLDDVEKEYLKLKEKYQKVYIGGTSIGANLSVILASRHLDISGVVLLAMPYRFKLQRLALAYVKTLLALGSRYKKKFYPPTFGLSTTITRLISYQTYPLKSVLEAHELVKKSNTALPQVSQPCLVMQSSNDHMVVKNNLEAIYNLLGSKKKEKKYVEKAYHTFISDIKNSHAFEDVFNFLDKN